MIMRLKWAQWFYGLMNAIIGGGAGAVVSGFTVMALAPNSFNLTSWTGASKVILAMLINFCVTGAFSMFFYLKQSPLPAISDSDPFAFRKTVEKAVEKEKVQEIVREEEKNP